MNKKIRREEGKKNIAFSTMFDVCVALSIDMTGKLMAAIRKDMVISEFMNELFEKKRMLSVIASSTKNLAWHVRLSKTELIDVYYDRMFQIGWIEVPILLLYRFEPHMQAFIQEEERNPPTCYMHLPSIQMNDTLCKKMKEYLPFTNNSTMQRHCEEKAPNKALLKWGCFNPYFEGSTDFGDAYCFVARDQVQRYDPDYFDPVNSKYLTDAIGKKGLCKLKAGNQIYIDMAEIEAHLQTEKDWATIGFTKQLAIKMRNERSLKPNKLL